MQGMGATGLPHGPANASTRLSVAESSGPQTLGDFDVIKTLGTGSFGKVKLARHGMTGHKVAMKYIGKKKISTADMADRVQREIAYLGMLQHPHIIKLYDVIQSDESIVMVIEYLKGELFNYIVKTGKMAEPQARRFFQQIIAAVEYCHSHGIVHRDLKPENLLLDDQFNVKIADFGLSNVMRDGDFLKTSCGSPNYAAPEVISGKLYAGPEIDIWSCGVILYVMLCGRLPFDDDHIPMLFKKINGGIFSIPPYLSSGARHLLSRMLLVDSTKRITIPEIRESPWFKENLPPYLAVPYQRPHDEDSAAGFGQATATQINETDKIRAAAEVGDVEGKEWIDNLGFIQPEAVADVVARVPGLDEQKILHGLRNGDKKIRISYQLCADSLKASLAASQTLSNAKASLNTGPQASPPPQIPPELMRPSTIGVLQGTVAAPELDEALYRSMQARNPLRAGHGLQSFTQSQPPQPSKPTKRSKPRWHFGIRSRSPPMEVMLEIYRTLQTLGFEWRKKEEVDHDPKHAAAKAQQSEVDEADEDPKRRRRREDEERIKKEQALYFVETRCRLGDIIVFMDIQLYQVDANDNYLVDFRNVGYSIARHSTQNSEAGSDRGSYTLPPDVAEEVRSRLRQAHANGALASQSPEQTLRQTLHAVVQSGNRGVSSPFLFLECTCKLIVELASPP